MLAGVKAGRSRASVRRARARAQGRTASSCGAVPRRADSCDVRPQQIGVAFGFLLGKTPWQRQGWGSGAGGGGEEEGMILRRSTSMLENK